MWLFTPFGFFSAVQKPGTNYLTVRARVAVDLEHLRNQYMPTLTETVEGAGTDYPFRSTISHADFAEGLARIVKDITYENFKDEVAHVLGYERAKIYGKVWSALLGLERVTESE
jgi:hypothetical protein